MSVAATVMSETSAEADIPELIRVPLSEEVSWFKFLRYVARDDALRFLFRTTSGYDGLSEGLLPDEEKLFGFYGNEAVEKAWSR